MFVWMSLLAYLQGQQIQGGQALHHKSSLRILVNKFDCCLVHITFVPSMIYLYGCPSLHTYKAQQILGEQALHHKSSLRILVNTFDYCMVHILFVV